MSLSTLYADYQKLEKNQFWKYFFEELHRKKMSVLGNLGTGDSLTEAQIRTYQGRYRELCDIENYPDYLAERIGEEIKGQSE